jgi:hypothetical protein
MFTSGNKLRLCVGNGNCPNLASFVWMRHGCKFVRYSDLMPRLVLNPQSCRIHNISNVRTRWLMKTVPESMAFPISTWIIHGIRGEHRVHSRQEVLLVIVKYFKPTSPTSSKPAIVRMAEREDRMFPQSWMSGWLYKTLLPMSRLVRFHWLIPSTQCTLG